MVIEGCSIGPAYVYGDHACLWQTARQLEAAGEIDSPSGVRALVEAVYGDGADSEVPEELLATRWEAEGKAGADVSIAGYNLLNVDAGYSRDGGAWDLDIRTPTRLDEDPQRTLRLARMDGARIVPLRAGWGARRALASMATERSERALPACLRRVRPS